MVHPHVKEDVEEDEEEGDVWRLVVIKNMKNIGLLTNQRWGAIIIKILAHFVDECSLPKKNRSKGEEKANVAQ